MVFFSFTFSSIDSVVDPRVVRDARPPVSVQTLSFACSFLQKFCRTIPRELVSSGKCWIRQCDLLRLKMNANNASFQGACNNFLLPSNLSHFHNLLTPFVFDRF